MPTFSIITTTYQHERFIAEVIESILAQSYTDWELLIGDDSPDDATWTVIESYREKYPDRIRSWHHVPNKGIVGNLNFLISQTSPQSQCVSFLEWDDRYTADNLQKKYAIFEEYRDVGLIYSDMSFINKNSEVTLDALLHSKGVQIYQNEHISTDEYILARNPLIVSYSSVAIRKEVLCKFLPIRNLTASKTYAVSDYDLFFQISRNHRVYGIPDSLTQYRRHVGNLSAGYSSLFYDLLILIGSYRKENLISESVHDKKIEWIYILQAITSLATWDKSVAWKLIKQSFSVSIFGAFLYKVVVLLFLSTPRFLWKRILWKMIRKGV